MLLQRLKIWLGGAGVGAAVAMIVAVSLGPRLIAWRWEPPEQAQLTCAPAVRSALGTLVSIELWTAGVGAVIGIVIAVLLAKRSAGKTPAA
jgi:hypothetical protein